MSEKSIVLTYFLWLVGGFLGLHHFYLGRDIQGVLWWCTAGGYFGCGWLRDLFLIPTYVKDANNDSTYLAKLSEQMRAHRTPPFSSVRFTGMVLVSYLFGSILSSAIPADEFAEIDWSWLQIIVPFGVALGAWCVGNIGREEGSIIWPLIGAYGSYPMYYYYKNDMSFTFMVMVATYAFDWKSKQWRRSVKPRGNLAKRTCTVLACVCLYAALWGCSIYFNGTLTDQDGEEIPIHEAVRYFFTSPWWEDFRQSLYDTWHYAQANGWKEVWKMIVELSDPHGEYNAYKVLGLESGVNQTVINSKCRQLSSKWHPDKVKEPELIQEAKEKFIEVQQACEILSTNKAKRRRKNKKST